MTSQRPAGFPSYASTTLAVVSMLAAGCLLAAPPLDQARPYYEIERVELPNGFYGCLVPNPLPYPYTYERHEIMGLHYFNNRLGNAFYFSHLWDYGLEMVPPKLEPSWWESLEQEKRAAAERAALREVEG